ncbi:MAG: hypothetical protein AUJ51_02270 [Elusimicrobia bacterium CG1_02_56_21]|nr:MAG: hypothetical protein AUJ51_02270 [Elusimicrobia bacterium CG1_02_56_21]
MKKIMIAVVMLGLAGGAYAAEFDGLSVKAAELKAIAASEGVRVYNNAVALPEAGMPAAVEKAFPADEAIQARKITKADLLGVTFSLFPKDGLREADLIISKDGSWTFKSTMTSGKSSGPDFELAERMQLWGDKEGQIALFGERGGPVMRLTAELRAKIEAKLGVKVSGDYVMTFFYGSMADGEAVYLFGGRN